MSTATVSGFSLFGTEALTFELTGRARLADVSLPEGVVPERRGDDVVVSVLLFRMAGLRAAWVPWPRFDYHEALWRVGVVWEGTPAWFARACDLDAPVIRTLGAWLVRYPVRTAAFTFDALGADVVAAGRRLSLRATAGDPVAPVAPRPVLTAHAGQLYEIPWREEPASWRHEATLGLRDDGLARHTFGEGVSFDRKGTVHRGRVHRCGLARKVTAAE